MSNAPETMPDRLDVSALGKQDLVNLVLQRSGVLGGVRGGNDLIRSWKKGDSAPLEDAVARHGQTYARTAAGLIRAEFDALKGLLRRLSPGRIADIGCGYAFFDLFAYHELGCDLLLIDIEKTEHRHFGFAQEGAGYSSLATATRFLTDNGVPPDRIQAWNPDRGDLPEGPPIDLAVSFLSCGFHYPVDMYLPFFSMAVQPRGAVILDLRAAQAPQIIEQLERVGSVRVLSAGAGVKRVLVRKWGTS